MLTSDHALLERHNNFFRRTADSQNPDRRDTKSKKLQRKCKRIYVCVCIYIYIYIILRRRRRRSRRKEVNIYNNREEGGRGRKIDVGRCNIGDGVGSGNGSVLIGGIGCSFDDEMG